MTLSFYNLPIQNGKINKYYGGGNNLPSPIFVLNTNKTTNQVSYQTTTPFLMNLRTKQNLSFNYVIIENWKHYEKTTTYWMLLDKSNTLGTNNYEYALKLDIFMTFDLLKPTTKNIPVKVSRMTNNWLKKVGTNLVPNYDRNPKIWDNKEFDLVPGKRKIYNVNPIDGLENKGHYSKTETWDQTQTFSFIQNYVEYKFNKQLFMRLLPKIVHFNDNQWALGNNVWELALITNARAEQLYVPVLYSNGSPIDKQSDGSPDYDKFITDNRLFNVNFRHLTKENQSLVKALAILSLWPHNQKKTIKTIPGLKSIVYVSNLFYHDFLFSAFMYIEKDTQDKTALSYYDWKDRDIERIVNNPEDYLLAITNHRWRENLIQKRAEGQIRNAHRLSTFNFKEKLEIPLNNNIWKWETYDNIALYSGQYFGYFFDFLGQQINTNNRLLYKNKDIKFYQTFYRDSEIIYYWQEETDQYLKSFQSTFHISYTKDIGDISYALRKNYYDARLSQVEIQKNANLRQVDTVVENQIRANNQLTQQQNRTVSIIAENQKQAIEKGKSLGDIDIGTNVITGAGVGTLAGPLGTLLGAASGLFGGVSGAAKARYGGDIRQRLIQDNQQAAEQLNTRKNRIANELLFQNARSTQQKVIADARAQKGLIQGEIQDLENKPGEIVSNQEGGLIFKPFQTPIAMIKQELHSEVRDKLKLYFNKFGNEVYNNFELTKGDKWWEKNVFFNYFRGGDWTNYLHDIGMYDPLIINEFNIEMGYGVRLWHRKYLKGDITNLWDINYYLPNWNRDNVRSLL